MKRRKKKRGFKIALKIQICTGPVTHQSGAGPHEDRRTKRQRTRHAQLRKIFNTDGQ